MKNHLLKGWDCLYLLHWIGAFTLYLLLKLPQRIMEPWFVLQSFFPLRLLFISINLPRRPRMEYCCYVWTGVPVADCLWWGKVNEKKTSTSRKRPLRLKIKQKWRAKKTKSKSKSESNSEDLRLSFIIAIHWELWEPWACSKNEVNGLNESINYETFMNTEWKQCFDSSFDLFIAWYYIVIQNWHVVQEILNLEGQAISLVENFLVHNSRANIFPDNHFF